MFGNVWIRFDGHDSGWGCHWVSLVEAKDTANHSIMHSSSLQELFSAKCQQCQVGKALA